MSRPDNNNELEFQEEWLSAYLDDELSPSQRAIVEQQLKSDVSTEKLFNDLSQIRGHLRALPAWSGRTLTMPILDVIQEARDSSTDFGDFHDELTRSDGSPGEEETLAASSLAVALDGDAPYEEPVAWGKSGTNRSASSSWLRPIVLAASLLAALGIGYVLWQGAPTWSLASVSRSVDSAATTENREPQDSVAAIEQRGLPKPSSAFDGVAKDSEAAEVAAKEMQADAAPMAMADAIDSIERSGLAGDASSELSVPALGVDKPSPDQSTARSRNLSPPRPDSPAFSAGGGAAPGAPPSMRRKENQTVLVPGAVPGAPGAEIGRGADLQAGVPADPSSKSGLLDFGMQEGQALPPPLIPNEAASESSSILLVSHSAVWNAQEIEPVLAQLSPLLGLRSVEAKAEVDGKLASAPPVAIITLRPASTLERISAVMSRTPRALTKIATPNYKTVQSTRLPMQALFLSRSEAQQLIEAIRTEEPSISPVWITSVAPSPPFDPDQKVVLMLSSQ